MAQLIKVGGAAALSVLALAVPAQAHDASFLEAAGPIPGGMNPTAAIEMGRAICDQLRIDPSTDDLGPRVLGRATWMYNRLTPQVIDAAKHELCPDTLEAGFVPGQSAEARFVEAAGPVPMNPTAIIQMGRAICDQLRINPSHDDMAQRVLGRAVWMYDRVTPQAIDAAQQELCPDTLGAGS